MEYYSAMKRDNLLIRKTTWVDLENIMLSEKSQSPKIAHGMFSFTQLSRNDEIIKRETSLVVARGSGRR